MVLSTLFASQAGTSFKVNMGITLISVFGAAVASPIVFKIVRGGLRWWRRRKLKKQHRRGSVVSSQFDCRRSTRMTQWLDKKLHAESVLGAPLLPVDTLGDTTTATPQLVELQPIAGHSAAGSSSSTAPREDRAPLLIRHAADDAHEQL